MNAISIARYRFTFLVTEAIRLNEYAGSMLRGGFGHALRQVACMTRARECKGCAIIAGCPYARVFAPHEIPRDAAAFATIREIPVPYVIEAPLGGANVCQPGELLSFEMVLLGKAIDDLPIITLAWQRAFGRGMGTTEGKGELLQVEHQNPSGWQVVLDREKPVLQPHNATVATTAVDSPRDFHLTLTTPLRIQRQKAIVGPRDITAALFLRNLLRRVSFIGQFHLGLDLSQNIAALNALADSVQEERRLVWQEWKRYSSRQQQEMDLGGLKGHWLLKQVPPQLQPFIHLGEWLHVGKETMFGLGGYKLDNSVWKPVN